MGQMLGRMYKKRHLINSPADLKVIQHQQATPERQKRQKISQEERNGHAKEEESEDEEGEELKPVLRKSSKGRRVPGRRSFADTSRLVYLDLNTRSVAAFPSVSNLKNSKPLSQSQDALTKPQESKGTVSLSRGSSSAQAAQPRATMDLQYVTERVLVFHVPMDTPEHMYRTHLTTVSEMLRNKHGDNYVIFNLCCSGRQLLSAYNSRVEEFGWPSGLAPSLEKLCGMCKSMEQWLRMHCVIVLHSRGEMDRVGVVMAAFLKYSSTFEPSESTDQQALDRFAMSRYLADRIGELSHPSQKRYVDYFGGLLTGSIQVNTNITQLYHMTVRGVPNFHPLGGCRAFVRVYQRMLPVFTSAVYNVSSQVNQFTIPIGDGHGIKLRGDVLVKCYHRYDNSDSRKLMFRCQFHTCAISGDVLEFAREQLDEACYDLRVPLDGTVRFHFVPSREDSTVGGLIRVEDMSEDPVVRWDSYDTLPHDSSNDSSEVERESPVSHLQGPLDGSLYATVTKQGKATKCSSPNSGAVSLGTGPHTASMDSGISSHSGLKDGRISGGSSSPPHSGSSGGQPHNIQATAEVHTQPLATINHTELDELVSGMLMDIQNIPDLKPGQGPATNIDDIKLTFDFATSKPTATVSVTKTARIETSRSSTSSGYPPSLATPITNGHTDSVFDDTFNSVPDETDIPYHARADSKPFSYGLPTISPNLNRKTPTQNGTGLESPTVVRKISGGKSHSVEETTTNTTTTTSKKQGLQSPRLIRKMSGGATLPSTKKPNGVVPSLQRSNTDSPLEESLRDISISRLNTSSTSAVNESPNQSWLQKQQAKLKERHELQRRHERQPSERQLLNELQHRLRAEDGYFSDSTLLSDFTSREGSPTKTGSYSTPLHINTSVYSTKQQTRQVQQQQQHAPSHHHQHHHHQHQSRNNNSAPNSPLLPVRSSSKDRTRGYQQLQVYQHQHSQSSQTHRPLNRHHSDTLHDRDRPLVVRRTPEMMASPREDVLQNEKRSSMGDRPVTPGFPVTPTPRTPYMNSEMTPPGLPPKSPTTQRKDRSPSPGLLPNTMYYPTKRNSNLSLNDSTEVISHHPLFVKDISKYWYKPSITRDDAIIMLKDKPPGTFVVRDSNSFPGAFGLALKVAQPPPNVPSRGGDTSSELVRHFLIEPTSKGVRFKGCNNEPVFGSLSALVYQHSITPLALPCLLVLPDCDPSPRDAPDSASLVSTATNGSTTAHLLSRGAACNLLYLYTMDTESLTGPEAIKKTMSAVTSHRPLPIATVVHFNVSDKGITITDNERKLFFRRHYPLTTISYCDLDPDDRRWTQKNPETGQPVSSNRCFGFVARKPASRTDNQCHLFAEFEEGQPATAIVRFITKALKEIGPMSRY